MDFKCSSDKVGLYQDFTHFIFENVCSHRLA